MKKRGKKTRVKRKVREIKSKVKSRAVIEPKREILPEKTIAKQGFLWYGLRIGFASMILSFIISFFVASVVISFIFLLLLIFNLTASIIHLMKYERKALAVVALIVSILFLILLGLFYALPM